MDEFMEDMWWDAVDDDILGEESVAYTPMGNEDDGPEDEDINWSSEGMDGYDEDFDFSEAPF